MFGVPGRLGTKSADPLLGVCEKTLCSSEAREDGPPPPKLKIPQFGPQSSRDPKNQIPRVFFMKIRPGGRSGDLNRTDFEPKMGFQNF